MRGAIAISIPDERHIEITWIGEIAETTSYIGVWASDACPNKNATVFRLADCGVTSIRPEEMRPTCNRTDEPPTPDYLMPAKYIEVNGECFALSDWIALALVGCWSNLTTTWSTGASWQVVGPAVAHGFAIPVEDWSAWDGAIFTVTADGASASGVVRVVY